ncbi:hypothetical protein SCUCBS95973_003206 [Sporothrix curviconia]|uniref:Uncharacterized protein n=1 Tax=Sporothrix curviconia TaxID=1260050 RepID=A0ABP0BDL9_9PEZI
MLDENLPTFIFRPMPDHPSSAVVYYTRSGSDPAPEYVLRIADPVSKPACRGVYAAALTDPYNSNDVVYGEVAVTPEWQQPTLSAAELREHRERGTEATGASPTAKTPDSFAVQLYNPDQAVAVRYASGSWNRTESWEFEIPVETFRMPSASRLDRQAAAAAAAAAAPTAAASSAGDVSLAPKNAFRWKRDGRLGNKDMTCYMVGQTVGLQRSKEPDITVALFKHGRDPAVTIYEPNLQRVDVQDRKGLDLVLLLTAQVIRDLYLVPRPDPFNMEGAPAGTGNRRKNSRPAATMSVAGMPSSSSSPSTAAVGALQRPHSTYINNNDEPTMTSALAAVPSGPKTAAAPPHSSSSNNNNNIGTAGSTPSAAAIDAETKRLQVMLEREENERVKRVKEEQRRIKKMLEAEEKERRLREAEVAKETERLRKMYGVEGQELPSAVPPPAGPPPSLSSRPVPPPPPPPPATSSYGYNHQNSNSNNYYYGQQQPQYLGHLQLPPRPVSAGPSSQAGRTSWWHGPSNNGGNNAPPKKSNGFLSSPAANISGFFSSSSSGNRDRASSSAAADERSRIQKKRSVHF